ncbi:MAG: DUF192 domain-containing protein [Phycisphaerales bacterium]|nr:DUF192 domain-containing protein [Phycisphaerales bacterium]
MAPVADLTSHRARSRAPRWALTALPLTLCGCAAMTGCDDRAGAHTAKVKINGHSFYLEAALDQAKRFRGLSERTHIEPDGGMLFVFPEPRHPGGGGFVMRDCPIGIDILYLDKSARVVTMYEMKPEPPRAPDEGTPGEHAGDPTPGNAKYENRLKQYVSRYPYTFVIELAEGKIKETGVKEGDMVEFDREGLMKQAR